MGKRIHQQIAWLVAATFTVSSGHLIELASGFQQTIGKAAVTKDSDCCCAPTAQSCCCTNKTPLSEVDQCTIGCGGEENQQSTQWERAIPKHRNRLTQVVIPIPSPDRFKSVSEALQPSTSPTPPAKVPLLV
jgi:hypothetical protein